MSDTVSKTREFVLSQCAQHKKNANYGHYDYWNDHIKRVVHHAVALATQTGADAEIVELDALLHDISMPAEYGERSEHNIYSAEMTEKLLMELNYPQHKINLVKNCVINHSGQNHHLRETPEERCVADADALAHFDRIPSLFSLAYSICGMGLEEGREYVREKLQGDYDGLSEESKRIYQAKFETIMATIFVD